MNDARDVSTPDWEVELIAAADEHDVAGLHLAATVERYRRTWEYALRAGVPAEELGARGFQTPPQVAAQFRRTRTAEEIDLANPESAARRRAVLDRH